MIKEKTPLSDLKSGSSETSSINQFPLKYTPGITSSKFVLLEDKNFNKDKETLLYLNFSYKRGNFTKNIAGKARRIVSPKRLSEREVRSTKTKVILLIPKFSD